MRLSAGLARRCLHERLGRRRVHEVEVDEVVDADGLKHQHDAAEVRA